MKKQTIFKSILMLVVMFLLLSACSILPQKNLVEGEERVNIASAAEPIADNLFLGMNEQDYSVFSHDFDETLKKSMDEKAFDEMKAFFDPKIGAYHSRDIGDIQMVDTLYVVEYTAHFEKEDEVSFQMSLRPYQDTYQIAGLWFDSPKLRGK